LTSIVVLGSLNTDLVVSLPRLPRPGETLTGDRLRSFPGGKGANQAVAAARLRGRVAMVGRVGKDDFGEQLIRNLESNGVDASGVGSDPGEPTGTALIFVAEGGQNMIGVAPGANFAVGQPEVDRAAAQLRPGDVLVVQLEIPVAAVQAAVERAGTAGARVILNAAPARVLDATLLRELDVVVANAGEAATLAGRGSESQLRPPDAARALQAAGVKTVMVTLGPEGSLVCDQAGLRHIEPFEVKAVDATGAGDAFVGALAVGLAAGLATEPAMRLANAAGAAATTSLGAQQALPRAEDLRRLFGIDLESLRGMIGSR
jgi:ribokinase